MRRFLVVGCGGSAVPRGVHHGPAALRTARRGYRQAVAGRAIVQIDVPSAQIGRRGAGQRPRAGRHLHRVRTAGQQLRDPRRGGVAAAGRRVGIGHRRHLGATQPGGGGHPDLGRRGPVPRDRPNDHAQQGHRHPQPPASGVGCAVPGRDDLGDVHRRRARHGKFLPERTAPGSGGVVDGRRRGRVDGAGRVPAATLVSVGPAN